MDALLQSTPVKNQPVPVPKTQLFNCNKQHRICSQLVQNWWRTGPEYAQIRNSSRTGPKPVKNQSVLIQNQTQSKPRRHHSESDSRGAVSSKMGLFRRLAAGRPCSSSMWAFLWREKLDECMKVLLQAPQVYVLVLDTGRPVLACSCFWCCCSFPLAAPSLARWVSWCRARLDAWLNLFPHWLQP